MTMNDMDGKQEKYPPWAPHAQIMALLLLAYLTIQYTTPPEPRYEIPYSQFKDLTNKGHVESLRLAGDVATGTLHSSEALGPRGVIARHFSTRIPAFGDEALLPLLEEQGIELQVSGHSMNIYAIREKPASRKCTGGNSPQFTPIAVRYH